MTLAATSWGTGEPLVLLHGFTGDASSFAHLKETIGSRFRVIAPDLPGHGRSAPAIGWDAALEELRVTVPESPFFLAGYSMGARLALAFSLRWPDRVRALLVESGSPGIADAGERTSRHAEDGHLAEFVLRTGIAAFVDRWEMHPTLAGLRDLSPAMIAAIRERRLRQSPEGLASALRHLGSGAQPSLWDELPRLHVPVLLVAGERDAKFSEIARRMAAAIPRAQLTLVPSSGHSPHLEAPDRYASALVAFFTQHGGQR
ncbi:MAG TPA: 2-succinyl-6-hydroxy-2,4-cyclohexadiene-1-carboxylate synthase [Myxococcales bacterium]|nr:2-succinyl-6-hydroxy-2,4-cyclohexadiene-1-carboxylate synthase [Myxococcales bacterium]